MVWRVDARRLIGAAAIFITTSTAPAEARGQAPLQAVIIVRHGEKATSPKENPPLSAAGEARARALEEALRDAGITAIITTDQIRTRATAAPLMAALRLQGVMVPRSADPREDANQTASAVRKVGGTVLVVGHQLTIPMVISALGGPSIATVCDVEYSNLYILLPDRSKSLRLIRGHYGTPDQPQPKDCHITPVSPP